ERCPTAGNHTLPPAKVSMETPGVQRCTNRRHALHSRIAVKISATTSAFAKVAFAVETEADRTWCGLAPFRLPDLPPARDLSELGLFVESSPAARTNLTRSSFPVNVLPCVSLAHQIH